MEKPVEVGNVIVIRDYEPSLRMTGVVTDVGEKYITCVMLTMHRRWHLNDYVYEFKEVEASYQLDPDDQKIEVLQLPSKEAFACCD